ncbi:MAG TPA: MBL fold metallo-hydrolase [Bacteroidales bacterium]|nr:MBL fold metallo-hydrolase [Bacteroidales bacterium]HOS71770.1 MBL fold metallo-hydrolase [Bacteroidales bacterium]HQH23222.1 MBL fold metallo-hydrolase [Bacteroidales bacterium]HQJ80920.1 MBL fold metallo-hydrolase [Bacteroidales bacterium]
MQTQIKISVLTDNHAGSFFPAEHGLSYLIEYDGKKILFDTGQSDMFLRNAEKLNAGLDNTDMTVLSHGHFDHGNGLAFLPGGKLVCHPGCFVRRFRGQDGTYIGLGMTEEEISSKFDLKTSADPLQISGKIIFLGAIPRITDFESRKTTFRFEDGTADFVEDDSALAVILPEGLFIISGCGHSGIVNTCEYARKITGISKLHGIMGGFHLKTTATPTRETIKYLSETGAKHVFPSHCTELPALAAFYEAFAIRQIKTGDVLVF